MHMQSNAMRNIQQYQQRFQNNNNNQRNQQFLHHPPRIQNNNNNSQIPSINNAFGNNNNNNNLNTMHRQILPQIHYDPENQLQNILKFRNKNNNQQQNDDTKVNENDNEMLKDKLRDDVILMKNKIKQIINERINPQPGDRNNNNNNHKKLNEELMELYTEKYLKHPEEVKNNNNNKIKTSDDNKSNDILIPPSKSLGEIIILGQTLYLLSSYILESGNIQISHKYILRALMYWRCANQCAKRMGAIVEPKYDTNTSLLNNIFRMRCNNNNFTKFPKKTNLDIDDLGFFWPQLTQCYVLAGNVFLKHFEYDVSDLMYRTALELCHCMEGRNHLSCIDPLELLMAQSIIKHEISTATVYLQEIIQIFEKNQSVNQIGYNKHKHLNANMVLSCLFRLNINNKRSMKDGLQLKLQCIQDCNKIFGQQSNELFNLYIYFIKHCLQSISSLKKNDINLIINYYKEADDMLSFLTNRFPRKLKYYEEYYLCKTYQEYIYILMEQSVLKASKISINNNNQYPSNQSQVERIKFLYQSHMKHVDNLYTNPLSAQFNRNMKIARYQSGMIFVDAITAYKDPQCAEFVKQQLIKRCKVDGY